MTDAETKESGCSITAVGAFGDRYCSAHRCTWSRLHDGPWCPGDERWSE